MKNAIIICSRLNSKRLDKKCFEKIGNKTVLELLLNRLKKTGIPIILAIPENESPVYKGRLYRHKNISYYTGFPNDPLKRMQAAAKKYNVENIIRISHDKIFIEPSTLNLALLKFIREDIDYLFGSTFTPGTGFEIIKRNKLDEAAEKYQDVEHIGYAIKAVTDNIHDYQIPEDQKSDTRLLIDYPADLEMMRELINYINPIGKLSEIIKQAQERSLDKINKLPLVTVYTCVYNSGKYIDECIKSVKSQDCYSNIEHIIVNDASTDKTLSRIKKYKDLNVITNKSNIGLSSSSNVALENATGKYIIRLDADDYFLNKDIVSKLISYMENRPWHDVTYTGNDFQDPREHHHIGGAIFRTSAINHIKFTERLRGYEGYDFFLRAKNVLNIGYFEKPVYYYRQHEKSLTKNNINERNVLKKAIRDKYETK